MRAIALALLVIASSVEAQDRPDFHAAKPYIDKYTDCVYEYGVDRVTWDATAGDIAEAALGACELPREELASFMDSSGMEKDAAFEFAESVGLFAKRRLIQVILETRNKPEK